MCFEYEHLSQLLLPQVIHLFVYHANRFIVQLAVAHLFQHWVVGEWRLGLLLLRWWWWRWRTWSFLLGDAKQMFQLGAHQVFEARLWKCCWCWSGQWFGWLWNLEWGGYGSWSWSCRHCLLWCCLLRCLRCQLHGGRLI